MMTIKSLLQKATCTGEFTLESARELVRYDWRTMIRTLPTEAKQEAETLFYFIEGYVEEVDEGFVDEPNDPELYERSLSLLERL